MISYILLAIRSIKAYVMVESNWKRQQLDLHVFVYNILRLMCQIAIWMERQYFCRCHDHALMAVGPIEIGSFFPVDSLFVKWLNVIVI